MPHDAGHRMIPRGSTAPAAIWCGAQAILARRLPASGGSLFRRPAGRRENRRPNGSFGYDIPDDSGILIEESLRPGHFDIFATFDQLHPYLAPDFNEEVVKGVIGRWQ